MESFFQHTHTIQAKLGYTFHNPDLLVLAFIHRSFWNENQELVANHNERLEFLGDSVLGLLIAEYLYQKFPETPEGQLSDQKAHLVEASACARYIHKLGLEDFLLLGKGEQANIGKGRESILADLLEAIIGAVYLDGGYLAIKACFFHHFREDIEELLENLPRNWKAELQDYVQKTFRETPNYEVTEESGPAHRRLFRVAVFIQGEKWGEGEGSSKKEAQAKAAEMAMGRVHE